jgi:hypothetical protein
VQSRDRWRPFSRLCWHFLKYSSFFALGYKTARECCYSCLWRPMYYQILLVMNVSSCQNVVLTMWVLCLSRHELIVTRSVPVADSQLQEISLLHD